MQAPSIFSTDGDGQISLESHETPRQTDTKENDEVEDESSIVVLQEKPSMIWRVRKALYGSPQAGRRWIFTVDCGCLCFLFEWRRWHFSPIDSLRREEGQHEELVKKLGEAKFRFTDKGEVEVFCCIQFQRFESGSGLRERKAIDNTVH
eukprot:g59747.t1